MGIAVFIIGGSGLGKSRSIKTMNPKDTLWIKVRNKPAPFPEKKLGWKKIDAKGDGNQFVTDNYQTIQTILPKAHEKGFKSIVIDDSNYLLTSEFMATIDEVGFKKFSRLANNVWELINTIVDGTPEDTIVYLMWHTELADDGSLKLKSVGKLVDEKINLPGLATVVLRADRLEKRYVFRTQHSNDVSKSPEGMFDNEIIDNDLKVVDDAIRAYYDI